MALIPLIKDWAAYLSHKPVSVDFLMNRNGYSLFDSTAGFEESKVILLGDIHGKTLEKITDINIRLFVQTGGYILVEGISFAENPPNPLGIVFGAEDMELHRQSGEIWDKIKSIRDSMHNTYTGNYYPETKALMDRLEIIDSKREDYFFSSLKYALTHTSGKVYLIVGSDHITNNHLLGLLTGENIDYSAYVPQARLSEEFTMASLLEQLKTIEEPPQSSR